MQRQPGPRLVILASPGWPAAFSSLSSYQTVGLAPALVSPLLESLVPPPTPPSEPDSHQLSDGRTQEVQHQQAARQSVADSQYGRSSCWSDLSDWSC